VYGGKVVENAIQALCRDLMAAAMLRAEVAGLRVVLTVHDEIVCDVPAADAQRAYDTLHACMTTLPPWAVGFPVGADGWVGFRYRK
jgi:DNA polymerase bacteriophage-type